MADDSKASPAPDQKATRSGAVKPPVLEGSARPSGDAKPAQSVPPRPAANASTDDERSGGGVWLAGIVGGVIGLGAAYGLALLGYWPVPAQAPPPADARVTQLTSAVPELETVTSTLQDELATLTTRVGTLETRSTAAQTAAPADTGLAEQLATLTTRVDDLAGTPAETADTEALAALQTQFAELQKQVANTETRLAATESQVTGLSAETSRDNAVEDSTARLPLIFSGLESAFASGRSYETELGALRQALPDAAIPEAISASAATGLPRADNVAQRLDLAIPDILAGRPATVSASWQDGAMDWMRGVIAMRPTGAVDGDSPDAIVARLEAAAARRDWVGAKTELDALPQTMRDAASPVASDIAALAAAQTFLDTLRSAALSGEKGA